MISEVLAGMLERHALAINCIALVLMALALIRPSSGMRMIVLGLLLAAAALIGIQNAAPVQADAAAAAGLAGFAPNATQPNRPRPAETTPAPQIHASPSAAKSRLITQPVRSGTQIYARGADLVVTAPVSAGA